MTNGKNINQHSETSVDTTVTGYETTLTNKMSIETLNSNARHFLKENLEVVSRNVNYDSTLNFSMKSAPVFGTTVSEGHSNFTLVYDMLSGIRTAVSRCQAKPARSLTARDFKTAQKLTFDALGTDRTPSSKFDFKFKDYAPWVFRFLRHSFSIDAAEYLVELTGRYILSELYSPGKSGSLFYYSQDRKYIIKTIRQQEYLQLRRILPHYYEVSFIF